MVIMEAARAIVNMPEVTQRELQPAVTVLQLFLTSSKPTLRFAAVRTLNKVRDSPATSKFPKKVPSGWSHAHVNAASQGPPCHDSCVDVELAFECFLEACTALPLLFKP